MKHLPSDFRWSFSKLASFLQCRQSFYLQYIVANLEEQIDSYYSQFGSFAHKILERYYKGELPEFCLADEWRNGYEEAVTMPPPRFPAGLGEKYFHAAEEYFEKFAGLPSNYEVLSVEKKFVITLEGYRISGIADLVIRDKDTGGIEVVDHKSKSMSSMKKERDLYRKQLYLYALWVHEEYGVWPRLLTFNMFKEHDTIVEEFSLEEMEKAKRWFIDTIKEVEAADVFEEWDANYSSYFCSNICSCAGECETSQVKRAEELARWREKKAAEEAMNLGY